MRRETNTATTASIAGMDGGETGGRGREGLVPGGQETDMQDQHAPTVVGQSDFFLEKNMWGGFF